MLSALAIHMLLWSVIRISSHKPNLKLQHGRYFFVSKRTSMSTPTTSSTGAEDEPKQSPESLPYFSIPSDPSFVHPVSDFPPLAMFEETLEHPALVVPARQTSLLRNRLSHVILHRPKLKSVYAVEGNPSVRKLLLQQSDTVFDDPEVQKVLFESSNNTNNEDCYKSTHSIRLTYQDRTVEEVLQRLLPVSEVPSAFETIGSIAHVNLRQDVLPFKYIVGKVILDKNSPRIRTVVNKLGTIETQYRTFGMEVVAGNQQVGWSIVKLKEDGCLFELDFKRVFWNTKLSGEHRRIVRLIQKDASSRPIVVADLMAGVGPFAIPLTSNNSNITVHANDLNPASYQYLEINKKRNKCQNLHTHCMDGRALVHQLTAKNIDFHHVIMNLPASAPECLDAFRGFTGRTLPQLHVHCFGTKTGLQAEQEAVGRCSKALGCDLNLQKTKVHIVRDVAPNKNMLCVSFRLPEEVRSVPKVEIAEQDIHEIEKSGEPESKRLKQA